MLSPEGYAQWTALFNPQGSWFEGSWEGGSHIRFVGPNEHGVLCGIKATVAQRIDYHSLTLKDLCYYEGDHDSEIWENGYERYTLHPSGSETHILVEAHVPSQVAEYMSSIWPRALARLKVICEKPESITVQVSVHAPLTQVWSAWTSPDDIMKWNQASPD